MIYTSNYKVGQGSSYRTYSISKDRGVDASYEGECMLELAPKESFFRLWRNNIGKVSERENNEFYMDNFYNQILKKLDPYEVYENANNSVLLCYEDNNQFCHRHIVAAWLELSLGIKVEEIIVQNGEIRVVDKPEYIKQYIERIMTREKDKIYVK